MKLGVTHMWNNSLDDFLGELRLSNKLGYDIVGIGDSPAGWRDLYVSLTLAVMETDHATITPFVTSPFLRHPLVVANAFSALQALSKGRMALGLAVGGSNVFSVGRKTATQKQMREYWDALNALMAGDAINWENRPVAKLQNACKTPVFYSAFGPKSLKLAGEKAEGVIMFTDGDVAETAKKIAVVHDAASSAGRNPDDVEIWVTAYCAIRDSREQAIEDIKAFLMPNALTFVHTPEKLAQVPANIKPKLIEMASRYDMTDHCTVNGKNVQILNEYEPELIEYLTSIHTVAGTAAEVKSVIDGLEDLGVSAFITNMPGHADRIGHMNALAELIKT
jgi:alkanesulfonate monooxygenase SsuD/methylene tetrahydromethanopterin reductase-like flavin-dependent oxidoreductase (luciferase family)